MAAPLAVSWEEIAWRAPTPPELSRAQRARIHGTYEAAIPATIATAEIAVDPDVVGEADDARAEISRFDAELSSWLPGELAPLPSVLLRTESAASSQIENITAGARALALAELGEAKHGSNAALVVANVAAMESALAETSPVTPQAILAMHLALMHDQPHARPGELRSEQVWIGQTPTPHGALFVPPVSDRVSGALADLCAFTARTDVPLLTQVAVAHAQFETIHPFNDGNGRTGRALVHVLLRQGGAMHRATLPVSAGLLTDTEGYFEALTAYRQGDLNPIVRSFTEAAFAGIRNGRQLAQDLKATYEGWTHRLSARSDASVWRVLPLLLSRPAVTSALVQERVGISQPAADNALRHLAEGGIVQNAHGSRRNVVFVAAEVIDALDAFAARARRR